jgi:hypothetical protein
MAGYTQTDTVWTQSICISSTYCWGASDEGSPQYYSRERRNWKNVGENYFDYRERLRNGHQCTTTLSGEQWFRTSAGIITFVAKYDPPPPFDNCQIYPHKSGESGYVWDPLIDNSLIGVDPQYLPNLETAENAAKTNFINKVREQQTTFQGGVAAGELNETLRMLRSPVKSLRKGLSDYLSTLKKRKKQVKRVSPRKRLSAARKVLADTWLEYSFGWKPFLSDIDDLTYTLANSQVSDDRKWQPINATGVDESFQPYSMQVGVGGGLCYGVDLSLLRHTKHQVTYRGSVSLGNPVSRPWKAGNFTNDFIPTVWELIPYSFLVDYFTNVGDVINAATLFHSNLRWTARTQVEIRECEILHGQAGFYSGTGTSGSSYGQLSGKQGFKKIGRAPYEGSLVPSLEFTVPNTVNKWLNMAALASGQKALVPFHR